ncbi:MAG: polysaccharide deacetylase family protein [Sulfurihydrogenibium azorense]
MKVLTYHNIDYPPENAKLKSLYVSPNKFESQIKLLKKLGFQTVLSDEINKSKKNIIFTFDDGYRDFVRNAYPILKKYNAKAIIFVVVGLTGKYNLWDWEKLNVKKPLMDWEEIKFLVSEGFEIGSHTITHPYLTKIPEKTAKAEIEDSKKILEDKLGVEIKTFCYPYGDYNERIKDLVADAGYKMAFTTQEGSYEESKDIYQIKRITVFGHYLLPQFLWKFLV